MSAYNICCFDHGLHQCCFQRLKYDLKFIHLLKDNVLFYGGEQIDLTIGDGQWHLILCKVVFWRGYSKQPSHDFIISN
jgi:hypothetical protein